jgi:hypothetical protein
MNTHNIFKLEWSRRHVFSDDWDYTKDDLMTDKLGRN